MIDFSPPPELAELAARVRKWVADTIVPFERDPRLTAHGPTDQLRAELVEKARTAGFLTIQAPAKWGGQDLSHIGQALVFEAAGWSTLGPVAMNCAAPDEGNMFLLGRIARPDQIDQYLLPMVRGERRSCFAMTEPGGAGSDPAQLATEAVFDGERYCLSGRKWLITGAEGARTWIIMARVAPNPHGPDGPTLFLCEGDTPGIVIERRMNSMDRNYVEGHAVVRFDGMLLDAGQVLGEVGQAFRYAQMRLAPARMTHCMRWLGAAARAHSIALDHAGTRTAFGKPIGEHQGVSFMLAENEIDLHVSRLLIWRTCWLMDQGVKGRHESSIAKAEVSERLFRVADRCVQVLGGIGITDETVVEMIYRDMRGFRLYDGPTEVHKYAIGRQLMRAGSEFALTPAADGLPGAPRAVAAQ
jgi:acyl-CoA dehydrogenase